MKASELIAAVSEQMRQYGDIEVELVHPDSGWSHEVKSVKLRDLRTMTPSPEDRTVIVISDTDNWL